MCDIDVAAISLHTSKSRKDVSATVIPTVARVLEEQGARYQRLPIMDCQIDWHVNETDLLTVALDVKDRACSIVVGAWGLDAEASLSRLVDLARHLCREHKAHAVTWHSTDATVSAELFLEDGFAALGAAIPATQIAPRRVRAAKALSTIEENVPSLVSNTDLLTFMRREATSEETVRAQILAVDDTELEEMEWDDRRAKSVPMRLSAWALSISTAVLAAPLAVPLLVHSVKRGEDVRAGALAFGVAGLFAIMSQSGLAPEMVSLL